MPSRKFCDLCDRRIDDKDKHFSIDIDGHSDRDFYRDDFFDDEARTHKPLNFETSMVCRNCVYSIRVVIERIKKDALQDGKQ